LFAIIYHYVCEKYVGLQWPYNTFLFMPGDRFNDFFNTINFSKLLKNGEFVYNQSMWNPYMPFMNWVCLLFAFGNNYVNFIMYTLILITFFATYLFVNIYKENKNKIEALFITVILLLTSYPLIFLIDRGNLEGLVSIFIGLFLYFYVKNKYFIASIILALCVSLKPFAIVFIVLFLSDKKIKETLYFGVFSAIFTIGSLAFLPLGLAENFKYWLVDLNRYDEIYVKGFGGAMYGHTPYNVLHILNSKIGFTGDISMLKKFYFAFAIISFIIIIIYIVKYEKYFWRKVFLLTLSMVWMPFISNDYTLISLCYPLVLYFTCEETTMSSIYNKYIVILSALIMIPKQYFTIVPKGQSPSLLSTYGISTFISPILILILLIVMLYYGFLENNKLHKYGKVNK
jgi:hypothetical protein